MKRYTRIFVVLLILLVETVFLVMTNTIDDEQDFNIASVEVLQDEY